VFLSVLGRYLQLKAEVGERDEMHAYARAGLLRYAEWMLAHEAPYFDHPQKLEYPTETWAAQDLRKANVLRVAAAHAVEPLRSRLLVRATELADRGWADLMRFESRACTRALALVLVEGTRDAYFRACGVPAAPSRAYAPAFGNPARFHSQRQRAVRQLKSIRGLGRIALRLLNPKNWGKLFSPR